MRFGLALLLALLPLSVGCVRLSDGTDTQAAASGADSGDSESPENGPPPPADVDRYGDGVLQRFVVRDTPGGLPELVAQTTDGRTQALLESVQDLGGVDEVVVSEDGWEAAALVSLSSGEQDIYVTDFDTRATTRVTTIGMTGISNIRFEQGLRPTRLVFNAMKDGKLGLWRVNLDGSGLQLLEESVTYGIWFDDDGNLVFRQDGNIYSIDWDGNNRTLLSTEGDPNAFPRVVDANGVAGYAKYDLYDLYGRLLSNESGTTGDVRGDKVRAKGSYFAYTREQVSNGRQGLYLVDSADTSPQAFQISLPNLDGDVTRFGFDPNGKYVWMIQGTRLLIHEIGGSTRIALDMGSDGWFGDVQYSLDGALVAVGATFDPSEQLVLHVLSADGSVKRIVDEAGEESGSNFAWIGALDSQPSSGSLLLYTPREHAGSWKFRIAEFEANGGTIEFQLRDEIRGLADQDIVSVWFDPGLWIPGESSLRAVGFRTHVGNFYLEGIGLESGVVETFPLGLNARSWTIPNNTTAPPKGDPDELSVSLGLEMSYFGQMDFVKNAHLEILPDGEARYAEWPPLFNPFGKVQFSVGSFTYSTRRLELDETEYSGRTSIEFSAIPEATDVLDFFRRSEGAGYPTDSAIYEVDPDQGGAEWVLKLGPYPF